MKGSVVLIILLEYKQYTSQQKQVVFYSDYMKTYKLHTDVVEILFLKNAKTYYSTKIFNFLQFKFIVTEQTLPSKNIILGK